MLFTSRLGKQITGSESDAFASNFQNIPDNTQAPAMIKAVRVNQYEGEYYFQITWELVDGDFKGCSVKQTIKPFERDDKKAERALNMLYRIFKLCDHRTDYVSIPANEELAELRGKVLDIKIGNGLIQGVERTWVREVWPHGDLDVTSGVKVVTSTPAISEPAPIHASSEPRIDDFLNDVPF